MGSIYTRKGSQNLWIKYYQNGRAVRESTGTTKETVARRVLRAARATSSTACRSTRRWASSRSRTRADDLLNDYKVNGRKTHDHAKRRIELHLKPAFQRQAADCRSRRRRSARSSTDRLAAGASPAEINRELAIVKRDVHAGDQGRASSTRSRTSRCCEEHNVRRGFFEPAQFEAVRRTCRRRCSRC